MSTGETARKYEVSMLVEGEWVPHPDSPVTVRMTRNDVLRLFSGSEGQAKYGGVRVRRLSD